MPCLNAFRLIIRECHSYSFLLLSRSDSLLQRGEARCEIYVTFILLWMLQTSLCTVFGLKILSIWLCALLTFNPCFSSQGHEFSLWQSSYIYIKKNSLSEKACQSWSSCIIFIKYEPRTETLSSSQWLQILLLKDQTSVTPVLCHQPHRLHKPHPFFPKIALSMRYGVCLHFVRI